MIKKWYFCNKRRKMMERKYWILAILAVLTLSALSCGVTIEGFDSSFDFEVVKGNGDIEEEERSVTSFDSIALTGIGTVYIEKGEDEELIIEAEENLMEYIETSVRNDTLTIGIENGITLRPTEPIIYYLTVVNLNSVDISGASDVNVDIIDSEEFSIKISGAGDFAIDQLESDEVTIGISGAGNVNIDSLYAENIDVNISGVGNLDIDDGEIDSQDISISGTGDYDAEDVESNEVEISLSGLGSATVYVIEELDVHISGAGSVNYRGNPRITQNVSGIGKLEYIGK
jgi:hypothetical protein